MRPGPLTELLPSRVLGYEANELVPAGATYLTSLAVTVVDEPKILHFFRIHDPNPWDHLNRPASEWFPK